MKRHLLTLLILILALGFYAIGSETSAVGALVIGGILEIWFWVRTLRGAPPENSVLH
jgi:hypothetical protein